MLIGVLSESGELGKPGQEPVCGIGLAFRGGGQGGESFRGGEWKDDAVAAHFPQGDFDDLGDGVAVEDVGDGIADIDHDHAQSDDLALELLGKSSDALSPAERRVLERIHKRETTQDIGVVHEDSATFGERLSDRVAAIGGSWGFIIAFTIVLFGWMILNSQILNRMGMAFDPYPFIFLNLMLSMIAALQAPIIMMSQNRQGAIDRAAALSSPRCWRTVLPCRIVSASSFRVNPPAPCRATAPFR